MIKEKQASMTRRVCLLMADGKPRSTREIAEIFDLGDVQVSDLMVLLHKTSRIAVVPKTYAITEHGRNFAEAKPKDKSAVNRSYREKKAAEKGKVLKVKAPAPVVCTVTRAIASRPALQAVWTSMASEVEA